MILHITTHEAWRQAQEDGVYIPASLKTEGFIHLSTPEQVVATANRFYRGQTDLVLLVVDTERLEPELLYEESEPGEWFPHLYGPLNLDAVVSVQPISSDPDGYFFMLVDW